MPSKPNIALWLSIGALGSVLMLALVFVVAGWGPPGSGAGMSTMGWTALVLGGLVTMVVGVGLVWLMIYSNRHGHDR